MAAELVDHSAASSAVEWAVNSAAAWAGRWAWRPVGERAACSVVMTAAQRES